MTSGQASLRAYRNRHSGSLVESRRRLPAQLDSGPKVLRQADDSTNRQHRHCEPTGRANARPMTGSAKQSRAVEMAAAGLLRRFAPRNDERTAKPIVPLPLPVADAARLARPDLNPRIEGLRVQGIAVSSHELRAGCAARFLRMHARFYRVHMRNSGAGNHDPFGLDDPGLSLRLSARLRALASVIGFRLDRNRRELRGRPERLGGKQRLGKIEAQELVGTVLIRQRWTAPSEPHRTEDGHANIFQDHSRPPEMLKNGIAPHLGSRIHKSNQCFRQGYRAPMLPEPPDAVVPNYQ